MLDDAVAAFLDAVSEREFDEPLLALIRAKGYTDVRYHHGQREFGKDAIGKLDGEQWAWQSKAGDVKQGDWRDIVGQLDELRLVDLGHGAFDIELPRRPVLVTTGRLKGNAQDLYRDYNNRARERGEPTLTLWDKDTLLADLVGNPDAILRGSLDGQLLAVLGSIEEKRTTLESLEIFSRRWTAWEPERLAGLGVVEAAVVCDRLRQAGRLDLACHLALCLLRGARAAAAGAHIPAVDSAARLFETYARLLWKECDERLLSERGLVGYSQFSGWVSYPVRCLRIGELLGLLALRLRPYDRPSADEIADWLAEFVTAQPGIAHPVSDRYAVSLIPLVLAIADRHPAEAAELLKQAAIWICDAYARGQLGLAGVDAEASEEVARLLGNPYENVVLERRRGSVAATVVLDLCAALGLAELYADAYNDFEAVRLYPSVLRVAAGPDSFIRTGLANRLDPHVDFAEALACDGNLASHHADTAGTEMVNSGAGWELLAISSALRDRHFVRAFAPLLTAGEGVAAAGGDEPEGWRAERS